MKQFIASCICLSLFFGISIVPIVQAVEKGGCGPLFGSCCLGPRIGLEMNEGTPIQTYEWFNVIVIGVLIGAIIDAGKNGVEGLFASCCIGPRVGGELDTRRIRTMEWLCLIPYVNIIPRVIMGGEAYNGKTMKDIDKAEGLKR